MIDLDAEPRHGHQEPVVAGLVLATPRIGAHRDNNRGGRDKPGHDSAERCFNMTGNRINMVAAVLILTLA